MDGYVLIKFIDKLKFQQIRSTNNINGSQCVHTLYVHDHFVLTSYDSTYTQFGLQLKNLMHNGMHKIRLHLRIFFITLLL